MERRLFLSKSFKKSYKKFTSNNNHLKKSINNTLLKLQQDAFDQSLRTHKLSGKLAAALSCSCGYDCRILFTIEKDTETPGKEIIVLADIGTHDDVY